MLQLRKATIVILAHGHNPSIISPDWVQKILRVDEQQTHFVHTPPFSVFDSPSYLLTVDTDRLELIPKVLDEDHITRCGEVAGRYLRTLPHIPYRSLGLNYIWVYSPEPSGKPLPQLRLEMNSLNFSQIFDRRRLKYGGTIRVELKPFVLTVRIEYEGDQALVFNYNFSHAISSASKAANMAKSSWAMKTRSEELTKSMLAGGMSGD